MPQESDIIVSGIMGSGKGTQSKYLKDIYPNSIHFEASTVIKAHVQAKDEAGKEILGYQLRGELVPDEMVIPLFEEALEKIMQEHSDAAVIYDGFPRTVKQAEMLERLLKKYGRSERARVIHLTLAETPGEAEAEIVRARAENRLVCVGPGKHTISLDQMSMSGKCPHCDAEVEARADDMNAESRKKRIGEYIDNVLPALRYLEEVGHIRTKRVSGLPKREDVFVDIQEALRLMDQEGIAERMSEYRTRV